jgi:hypothetical protein
MTLPKTMKAMLLDASRTPLRSGKLTGAAVVVIESELEK